MRKAWALTAAGLGFVVATLLVVIFMGIAIYVGALTFIHDEDSAGWAMVFTVGLLGLPLLAIAVGIGLLAGLFVYRRVTRRFPKA